MMTTPLCLALTLPLLAPAGALLPNAPPCQSTLPAAEAAALHARFEPRLGTLRAGRSDAPLGFDARERAELAAAQRDNPTLASLRAGSGPSNNEVTWLVAGAVIVLLILLL